MCVHGATLLFLVSLIYVALGCDALSGSNCFIIVLGA